MMVLQISLMNLVMNTVAAETVLKKVIKPALQIRASQQSITASLWPLTAHSYHVMIIVTMVFPRNLFLLLFAEVAVHSCSSKQVLLEILQYSQENICLGVSF